MIARGLGRSGPDTVDTVTQKKIWLTSEMHILDMLVS